MLRAFRTAPLICQPVLLVVAPCSALGIQNLPDVDSCISRLDPATDIGYERIVARCPDLVRRLEEGGWAAWMPGEWKEPGNDLSAGSLRELRELARREMDAAPAQGPDIRSLKPVLASLADASAKDRSVWARFKGWVRSVLESREQPAGESWFTRMTSRIGFPQSVVELVSYAALAGVVALALLIVLNELRAAGLIGPADAARRGKSAAARGRGAVTGGADSNVDPRDRPRMLLGLIVARLGELGCLPPSAGLTVRELTLAARLAESDRERLSVLALSAERLRYSGSEIAPDGIGTALERGRELLENLSRLEPFDAGAHS